MLTCAGRIGLRAGQSNRCTGRGGPPGLLFTKARVAARHERRGGRHTQSRDGISTIKGMFSIPFHIPSQIPSLHTTPTYINHQIHTPTLSFSQFSQSLELFFYKFSPQKGMNPNSISGFFFTSSMDCVLFWVNCSVESLSS